MLRVLEERSVPISELIPVASETSIGKKVRYQGKDSVVVGMERAIALKPDFALFSAGGDTSLEWAPRFAEVGCVVIDNSSAWRMDPDVPLVVPEVNFESIPAECRIIANPNCSTIQLVVALAPLNRLFGIDRIVVSTYQSVSGTGKAAIRQLEEEESGQISSRPAYVHPIHRNCIPQCDVFLENGYTKEEMKLVNESRKILGEPKLRLTATAVRVPVIGGHSEAVNVMFKKRTNVSEIRAILSRTEGVTVQDNPAENLYPMPKTAHETDSVYVGRIREDESEANAFNLWIVSDNLRKGAATNAVQILQRLIDK